MNTVSFLITIALAVTLAAIGVALAPARRKLVAILSVIGLSAMAASAPAVADFSSNPTGHTHPAPALPIGAYTLGTPSPSCTWTANTTIQLSWTSSSSAWQSTQIQRWANAPGYSNLTNTSAGTTTYNDNSVTGGTLYSYQMYGDSATNWVGPTSSALTSTTCTGAMRTLSNGAATAEIHQSYGLAIDSTGDIAIADTGGNYVEYVPKYTGTYFGISMTAGNMYWVLGTGSGGTTGDAAAVGTSDKVNAPQAVAFDSHGNIIVADTGGQEVRLLILGSGLAAGTAAGTYFNASRKAGWVYDIAGQAGSLGDTNGAATSTALLHAPAGVALDANDNVYIADSTNNKIKALCNPGNANCTLMGVAINSGNVGTVAGNGTAASVDSGTVANQEMSGPDQITLSPDGTKLYIADTGNHEVRKVVAGAGGNSTLSTVFGNGGTGDSADGTVATAASASGLYAVTVDSSGNLIVGDTVNDKIKIVPASGCLAGACPYGYPGAMVAGDIYLLAGTGASGDMGPGLPTYNLGIKYSKISNVRALAMGPDGNIYFTDGGNDKIRELVADSVQNPCTTPSSTACTNGYDIVDVVGNGTAGAQQGLAAGSLLNKPQGVVADTSGNLYIADSGANIIREYIASTGETRVVAGTGSSGTSGDASAAVQANLSAPGGVALDQTNSILYIAGNGNNKIRAVCVKNSGTCTAMGVTINAGNIDVVAGTGTAGTSANSTAALSAKVSAPQGVAWDATNSKLYIADTGSDTVKVVSCAATCGTATNWVMSLFAGTAASSGYGGDGGSATALGCLLSSTVTSVAVDSTGANVYIADTGNQVVRKVNGGTITKFAGTANSAGSTGDGAAATSAKLSSPAAVSVNSSGTVYIADSGNHKIRYVVTGGNINNMVGTGTQGYTNDGGYYGLANIDTPQGVAVLNSNLYFAQTVTGADAAVRVVYGEGSA